MTTTIRPRREADVPLISALIYAQRDQTGYPVSIPPSGMDDLVRRAGELGAWVAERGDEVVGHVSVLRAPDPIPEVDAEEMAAYCAGHGSTPDRLGIVSALVVSSDVRGTGVGRQLLEYATDQVLEAGLLPCLDVVAEHTGGMRLYEKLGWERVGEINPPWLTDGRGPVYAMVLRVQPSECHGF